MSEERITSDTGGQKGKKAEQFHTMPYEALAELARVYSFGMGKYAQYNFRNGYEWSLSFDALMRHAFAFWSGETDDEESGLNHMAHAAWHCINLVLFSIKKSQEGEVMTVYEQQDDRPTGPAADFGEGSIVDNANKLPPKMAEKWDDLFTTAVEEQYSEPPLSWATTYTDDPTAELCVCGRTREDCDNREEDIPVSQEEMDATDITIGQKDVPHLRWKDVSQQDDHGQEYCECGDTIDHAGSDFLQDQWGYTIDDDGYLEIEAVGYDDDIEGAPF